MSLFNLDKKLGDQGMDTIIGEKASLKGELFSSGTINLFGEFEGRVVTKGDVIVSQRSKVIGNIECANIIVSGRVDGNIAASHCLEITKSGRVHGDLKGGKIIIEEGSSYRGRVSVIGALTSEKEQDLDQIERVEENPDFSVGLLSRSDLS
ncbi:hypothetical protein COT42_06435 [Candidatus Saganbacteria bacterium CG08_land_8_20_14_0_20_45_16]|uniref:Cell shape determination protein CcmA n=1 Tax=Candidatus Saganbacteria bacterium CG08_land_8_20_14_0_20_45_16 TaxID=2014293 RepID=A0A2H0XW00_UNCSA|nr:MAG: hypothetical protein COT42_06435 [Candidatus Saganbacteria bacterium CG08_land_8_20_14_0_20_45_16]